MDFNLKIPVKVISGKGCVRQNAGLFSDFGKKCLIVTGGRSAKLSGALDDVVFSLESEGIEYRIFDKIGPNPRLDHCFEGGEIAREFSADFIVGIGGGSPLDAAKAVAVYAANEDLSMYDIYTVPQNKRNKALPLVLIGTTSGTGSEVGRVSVLSDPKTGRKKSISPDDCNSSLTFADSSYTNSMPFDVTVSTALDALSHALEGYMSVKCSDIPTLFGEKAIKYIFEGLIYLYKTGELPNEELREKLYYGSLYAGITLSYCGTAFPHPLGYILTENFGVPHGKACSAFLDEFIDRADIFCKEKTEKVLEIMGVSKEEYKKIIVSLTALDDIRMSEDEILSHCSRFDTPPANFTFSPGSFTKEDAIEVFEKKFLK